MSWVETPTKCDDARPHTLEVQVQAPESEEVAAQLWELGATGVEERDAATLLPARGGDCSVVAYFASGATAQQAAATLGTDRHCHLQALPQVAWQTQWQRYFHPTRVAQRWIVYPPWHPPPRAQAAGRLPLIIDPGLAFGSGTHATTRLCLAAMESELRPDARVVDLGCGSGILAIAAARLGARAVLALDIDADAVAATAHNAAANDVAQVVVARQGDTPPAGAPCTFLIANIRAPVLCGLEPKLRVALAPGGRLLLSGILASEQAEVTQAYADWPVLRILREGEWVALLLQAAP